MKLKSLVTWILLCCAAVAQAEIYKCTINGVVSYSDAKCGSNAKKVELIPEKQDLDNGEALKRQAQNINRIIDQKAPKTGGQHDRQIGALEQQIADLRAQMEAELSPLRQRRERTDRDSLQRELDRRMQSITAGYEARIKENQDLIDGLRARQ